VSSADAILDSLVALHDEIDREAGVLAEIHASRLQCGRGCSACCLDDLNVAWIEAERIRRAHPDLLKEGEPHEVGACAFLDAEGACRIYEVRPAVCRSQGLPLRILFENESDEIEERRDICPLNLEGGPDLALLDEDDCWLVGPHEWRLSRLDDLFRDLQPSATRTGLRSLFEKSA
jgi:Fe-S-cluster containining protein